MRKEKSKDTLSLSYKMLNDQGVLQSKSTAINNLSDTISDNDLYLIAQSISELLAYACNEVHRKTDFLFLED